ncbi:MAG TPA: VC0807 family protein [Streptosporangiaceae bacterium]|nr:VC0807 family protein [Streptosporangiaceae bacterium]
MATSDLQLKHSSFNQGGFDRSRLRSLAPIAVFDLAGPLAVYWLLRAAGTAEVTALIASGILPAFGVILGIIRRHRVDAIGALVLLGIVAGTVVGLLTHSSRLVLMEGSVPTAIFGLTCLGSLLTSQPLLYRIAREARGEGTAAASTFEARWGREGARRTFGFVTLVWGLAFLAEAAARVLIVEFSSAGNALLIVKVMPYLVILALIRWTASYARRAEQRAVVSQAMNSGPAHVLAHR